MRNLNAVINALEKQISDADAAVAAAEDGVKQAIVDVQAAHISERLAEAQKLYDAYAEILPELNVGSWLKLQVNGLHEFVHAPAAQTYRELYTGSPRVAQASAMFRTWGSALQNNPSAEPDQAAADSLLAAEAAERAARDAAARAEEERYAAEMRDAQRAISRAE